MSQTIYESHADRLVSTLLPRLDDFEHVYSLDDLAQAAGVDHNSARQLVYRVNGRLLKGHNRCLRNVRGAGYRIAAPNESADMARERNRRASDQLKRARAILKHTDVGKLTPMERSLHDAVASLTEAQIEANARNERRFKRQERMLAECRQSLTEHDQRLGALETGSAPMSREEVEAMIADLFRKASVDAE